MYFPRYDPLLLHEFKIDFQEQPSARIQSIEKQCLKFNFKSKGILDIFKHIGISFSNKYSKNVDEYKLIEGTLGLQASIKLLLRITKYVKIFSDEIQIENTTISKKDTDIFYDKILHECCINQVKFFLIY